MSALPNSKKFSESGAALLEMALLCSLLLPVAVASLRPLGKQVHNSFTCANYLADLELGGGSSTTEDLPEAHGPDPMYVMCVKPH